MTSLFDVATVGCFLVLLLAFFMLTNREPRTLSRMLVAVIAFAVANQLGNAGWTALAAVLILAGAAYAVFVVYRY